MQRKRHIRFRCDVTATGGHAIENRDGKPVFSDRYGLSGKCGYCSYPIQRMRRESAQWFTPQRECLCEICDREYVVWFAPNDLWNPVMRPNGYDERAFICPTCFTNIADQRGVKYTAFEVRVEVIKDATLGHYLQSGEFPGFDYADIAAAYTAGCRDARQYYFDTHAGPPDDFIERCADAYVKKVAPVRQTTSDSVETPS